MVCVCIYIYNSYFRNSRFNRNFERMVPIVCGKRLMQTFAHDWVNRNRCVLPAMQMAEVHSYRYKHKGHGRAI